MKLKRFLTYSGITLILLVITLFILPFVINLDNYIAKITVPASKAIGRRVSIKHLRLTILTGVGMELKGVRIDEKNPSEPPFVRIGNIDIGIKLLPLLKEEISVNKITFSRPRINIIRYKNGSYNFSDLLRRSKKSAKMSAKKEKALSNIPEQFYVDKFLISDGEIHIVSFDNGKEHNYGLNNINLNVTGFNVNKPFSVSFGASLEGLKDARLDINGIVGPIGRHISIMTVPLNITASLSHIDIPYVLSLAGIKEHILKSGVINIDETLKSTKNNIMNINGKIRVSDLTFTNATVKPFVVTDNLQFYSHRRFLSVNDITFRSKGINLGLKGKTNLSGKSVHVSLFSRQLSINRLLAFYSPLKQALPHNIALDGDAGIKANINNVGNNLNIKGIIDLSNAKISYPKLFIKPTATPFSLSYDITKRGSMITMKKIKLIVGKLGVTLAGTMLASGNLRGNVRISTNTIRIRTLKDIVPLIRSYNAAGQVFMSVIAKGAFRKPEKLAVRGRLIIKNVSALIASLPKPLKAFNMDALFTQNSFDLKSMNVGIGSSVIKANGKIRNFSAPHGRFNIKSSYLNMDELMPAFKSHKASNPRNKPGYAKKSVNLSRINKTNIVFIANIQKGVIKKARFKRLVTIARLTKGNIVLEKFNVHAFSGSISANGALGIQGTKPYNIKLTTKKLNLGDILNTFTSFGDVVSGSLKTNMTLKGNMSDFRHTVSGKGLVTVTDGEIKTFSMLSGLLGVARIAGTSTGKTTRIKRIKLTAVVNRGRITSNNLKFSGGGLDVSANGYFDFDGNLNYRGIGILSKSLSDRVGGTGGKFIKNGRGRVEIPFILSGTIRKPAFGFDVQIYKQKLKELAKRKVIRELNKQLNKELKKNKTLQQIKQNVNLRKIENKGKKEIEQLLK